MIPQDVGYHTYLCKFIYNTSLTHMRQSAAPYALYIEIETNIICMIYVHSYFLYFLICSNFSHFVIKHPYGLFSTGGGGGREGGDNELEGFCITYS